MEKLPLIEMAEINNYILSSDSFHDMLAITEVDASLSDSAVKEGCYTMPVRLNALFIVLVMQGEANISLDYVHHALKKDIFITIMPSHIFQLADSSSDFKAIVLMVDPSFLEELKTEKRTPMMSNYLQLRNNPCTEFLPEETKYIYDIIQSLRSKIKQRNHSFHKELLQNAFIGFLLEMANILVGKNDALTRPTLSRKEDIMNEFLQLLFKYVKEHHLVSFYAEKLFITPQYLSLILKELTGKSANKWIDEALMMEAKILLKMPHITVQQVADQLNFSDQSTFGKFFKKHMGVSPMEYRKS